MERGTRKADKKGKRLGLLRDDFHSVKSPTMPVRVYISARKNDKKKPPREEHKEKQENEGGGTKVKNVVDQVTFCQSTDCPLPPPRRAFSTTYVNPIILMMFIFESELVLAIQLGRTRYA
ncbi:hypothetical protein RUM44_006673 [Polyplax serrata]|uniref:Uncharacterized protein n=1 Tax=Polyplax serrata TaxID=468196 RepID=A0ABR1AIZ7_POLSC